MMETTLRLSRSPCGERGLKFWETAHRHCRKGRSPCGERGLKFPFAIGSKPVDMSLPVRGAWIEIMGVYGTRSMRKVAPRAGSVD